MMLVVDYGKVVQAISRSQITSFFLAVECLERAAVTSDPVEKDNLAREAFNFF